MTLKSKIGYSHQWSNAYYQVNFWCGFCKKIIQASHDPHKPVSPGKGADDNDASNHRWDHIGAHFDKGKLKMDKWLYWECPETIGNLKDVKFVRESHDGKENPRKEVRKKEKQMKEKQMREGPMREWSATQQDAVTAGPNIGKKRKAGKDHPSHQTKRPKLSGKITPVYWECVSLPVLFPFLPHCLPCPSFPIIFPFLTSTQCECGNGPLSIQNHASCPETCGHQRCDGCDGNYARDGGEEAALLRGPHDSWGRNGASPGIDSLLMDLTAEAPEDMVEMGRLGVPWVRV